MAGMSNAERERIAQGVRNALTKQPTNAILLDFASTIEDRDFWLKAVRECEPEKHEGMYECAFCGNSGMPVGLINHKPDCPWMRAKKEQ